MTSLYDFAFLGADDPLPDDVITVSQVHGTTCLAVPEDALVPADALTTTRKDTWIGVKTADCVPVLFAGEGRVAAAHAGWRGALAGVLEETLRHFDDVSKVECLIGPAIQKASYEVSLGFEQPFLDHSAEAERFFYASEKPDKLMFDVPGYCAGRLAAAGVQKINLSTVDTFTDKRFHSFRRDAQNAGRNYAIIRLRCCGRCSIC